MAIVSGVCIILPLFVIIASNIKLCLIAAETAQRMEKKSHKALVTVCALSGIFVLSWLPWFVAIIVELIIPVPLAVPLLAHNCIYLNTFANPILYCITNKSFGTYVKKMLVGYLHAILEYTAVVRRVAVVPIPAMAHAPYSRPLKIPATRVVVRYECPVSEVAVCKLVEPPRRF